MVGETEHSIRHYILQRYYKAVYNIHRQNAFCDETSPTQNVPDSLDINSLDKRNAYGGTSKHRPFTMNISFMYLRAVLCTFQVSVDFYYVPVGGRGGGRGGAGEGGGGARERGIECVMGIDGIDRMCNVYG